MNIKEVMESIGINAKAAAQVLSNTDGEEKDRGLREISSSLRDCRAEIIAANNIDMENSSKKGLSPSMLDRLNLNEDRVDSMAKGLEEIATLNDPIGVVDPR